MKYYLLFISSNFVKIQTEKNYLNLPIGVCIVGVGLPYSDAEPVVVVGPLEGVEAAAAGGGGGGGAPHGRPHVHRRVRLTGLTTARADRSQHRVRVRFRLALGGAFRGACYLENKNEMERTQKRFFMLY